jgi:two-component system, OmpR family, osmolarity sensor histidine kinase EnvZ
MLVRWMPSPRLNSLFARLLVAQLGLVLALGLVFGGLFYVERSITVSVLYADLWAPHLVSAMDTPASGTLPPNMRRSDVRPASARQVLSFAPRFSALRQALIERGVPVADVLVGRARSDPGVWLHLQPVGGASVWLGIEAQLLAPQLPLRLLLAFIALAASRASAPIRLRRLPYRAAVPPRSTPSTRPTRIC